MKKYPSMLAILALTTVATLSALSQQAYAEAPKLEEITACLGGSDSGALSVFATLSKKMAPAEVGAIWKGAEVITKLGKSDFATSKVKAKGCAGAAEFEFSFIKDKANGDAFGLRSTKIIFDKKLVADDNFYTSMLNVLSAKYGEPKPADIEKKLLTWLTKDKRLVQFVLMPTMKGKQFTLMVTVL